MSGASIAPHEWAAMAEYARRRQAERMAAGDHSVPGFPDAESSAGYDVNSEPADVSQDPEQWAFIVSSGDQCRAATEHAAHFDNTDAYGLHFSTRLEHVLGSTNDRIHENEWHYVQFDYGEHWAWAHRVDGTKDTMDYSEAVGKGAILGVVSSHMIRRADKFVYVIEPGSVPKWLQYVGEAGWRSCVVKRCRDRAGCTGFASNKLVVARSQWLYDLPVCDGCLRWLRAE